MITDQTRPISPRRLRTPRSAALAGIVFSILIGTSAVLIQLFSTGTYWKLRLGFPIWFFVVSLFILRISTQKFEEKA